MSLFDLKVIPFSRYGSYFAFSHIPRPRVVEDNLYLKTVHGSIPRQVIFRLSVLHNGVSTPFTEDASPARLRLESEGGEIEICIPEPQLIRLRGRGVGLRLHLDGDFYETAYPASDNAWVMNSSLNLGQYRLTSLRGNLAVNAPWDGLRNEYVEFDFLPGEDGNWEAAIEEFKTSWQPRDYAELFESSVQVAEQDFDTWLGRQAELPADLAEPRELAAYITWSCMVAPRGHLRRPTMYMSKNWMTNVWSWDHCFNALAQAYHNPDVAWDQLMVLFDQQDEFGALPDVMNDNGFIWNFCKPPVHGWALRRLMAIPDLVTPERLAEIYGPLCRWTDWFFTYRDDSHNGLPEYTHGNDSGWDNATIFALGVPVESPDLAAYLVLQMDVLADVAGLIGKPAESDAWKARADDLLEKMLARFWQGDHFVARLARSQQVIEAESLILFQPLILGKRLPDEVSRALVAGLKQPERFLTEYGWASESVASPYYVADGYWRGALWAAPTLLLVDGLAAVGETEFARDISRRFCQMAAAKGMAENYDARTGDGLRDRSYSWTSSIFMILGHEFGEF